MSTNASSTTEHYGLSQWAAGDGVCRTDFNSDNAIIDAALHSFSTPLKLVTGTYFGAGAYGAENPVTLTFDFEPKFLYVWPLTGNSYWLRWVYPGRYATKGASNMTGQKLCHATLSGRSLSWYNTDASDNQLNANNLEYVYVALGF